MGWGKKTTGAQPQPAPALAPTTPLVLSESIILNVPVAEQPTDAAKAEMAWAQLRSKKGWVPDTVALLLYEFVKHRGLFEDLTAFAKKRK